MADAVRRAQVKVLLHGAYRGFAGGARDVTLEAATLREALEALVRAHPSLAERMRDEHGRRPVNGGTEKFQSDPYWRDHMQFFEYFHGDNGAGLGASHQTGWTGLVAKFIELFGLLDAKRALEGGKLSAFRKKGA